MLFAIFFRQHLQSVLAEFFACSRGLCYPLVEHVILLDTVKQISVDKGTLSVSAHLLVV